MRLVGNTSMPLIVATLLLSNANKLKHFSPESNRLVIKRRLIRVYRWAFPDEIDLVLADNLRPLVKFPEDVEDWVDNDDRVVLEEVGDVPWLECSIAVAERHNDIPEEAEPGAIWLEPSGIRLGFVCQRLHLLSTVTDGGLTKVLRSRPCALQAA